MISMLEFLIENIFVSFGGPLFQQIVGIPMGTNCAPLLVDLFVYSYESEFLQNLVKDKKIHEARTFNFTYQYIDDVLSINNPRFAEFLPLILTYLPTLPFCTGVSRTNKRNSGNLPHSDILTRNDPHSYFWGFFITVNRSKQTVGDHLKTLVSSFHVRFISNGKLFLPYQLQQERGLCLDQAAV